MVNNISTGTWNITNDYFLETTTGGGTFNNAGTFEQSSANTIQVEASFVNTGTVEVNACALYFVNQSSYTQTAGNTLLNGGGLETASTSTLQIEGGTFSGSGTITGDLSNGGGTMAPGTSTTNGAVSLSGSGLGTYTQGSGGTYDVKIGGSSPGQYDSVAATGAVAIGGTLNVSFISSFTPSAGNSFTILSGSSVTGTFATTNLPTLNGSLQWKTTYNPASVVLTITSTASGVATLNSSSIAFANTVVDTPSAVNKTVTLQNTGTGPLTIASIAPSGADSGDFSYASDASAPCPISPNTLGTGNSCTLDITFTPQATGSRSAQITITDNSGGTTGSTQNVSVSGTGIQLSSIAVTPGPTYSITQGSAVNFNATGTYTDNSTQSLTTSATWNSSSPTVATIGNTSGTQGRATGVSGGTTNITASYTTTQGSLITSNSVALTVTTATHLVFVSVPATATAGVPFNFTIYAEDANNAVVPGYSGTVQFSSSDPQAVLPVNSTLTSGQGTFSATLKTGGTQTMSATDTVTSTIAGTSPAVTVNSAGTVTHFAVSAPASATAGTPISFTVTAEDAFNNTVTTYAGTAHFSSSDGQASLPANSTLSSGTGTFSATLKTAGGQEILATDTSNGSITGTSAGITVSAAPATHFSVSAPGSAVAGAPFSFTVTAQDPYNNTATSYPGMVHFTSTDPGATLPANAVLSSGSGSFSATLKTVGTQSITATDTVTGAVAGTSNAITVNAAAATHFTVSAPGTAGAGTPVNVTVTAFDQFNNLATGYTGIVHFTSTDPAALLPGNSNLTSGSGTFSVTFKTPGSQTVTATDTVTSTITGTSALVSVSAGAATHFVVTAPPSATAGTPFNITVTAEDVYGNTATGYTGTVHFTSSDTAAVLPGNSTLNAGTGTFSATLKTTGSQTITATDTVNVSINGTSGAITVGAATLESIAVTPASPSIAKGQTQQFTATGTYSDSSTANITSQVTWTSATTTVATITTGGLATGTGTGTSNITASLSGVTSPADVLTVTSGTATLVSIALSPSTDSLPVGATQQFTATGTYSDSSTQNLTGVTWASTNTAAATISTAGFAQVVGVGSTTVSASMSGVTGTAALTTFAPVYNVAAALGSITTDANGNYIVQMTITNDSNVTLSSITFASATLISTAADSLPSAITSLAPGGSVTVTLVFSPSAGTPGARGVVQLQAGYVGEIPGGTNQPGALNASARITLP